MLRALFRAAADYGPHAVGLAYREGDEATSSLKAFKRAIHPYHFLRNCNHRIERAARHSVGFGHTRYGTHGSTNDNRNAHPFGYTSGAFNAVYAHNGIIGNYQDIVPAATVDSECLGPLIHDRNTLKARGSIGLIWFENDVRNELGWRMFVYRRNQNLSASRVTLTTGESGVIIHSRRMILEDCDVSCFIDTLQPIELAEGVAYEVASNTLVPTWKDAHMCTSKETTFNLATYRGG